MQSIEQRASCVNQILIEIEHIVEYHIGKQHQADHGIRNREQQLHPSALFQNMPRIRNRAKIQLKQKRCQITVEKISVVQKIAEGGIRFLSQKPYVVCFCPQVEHRGDHNIDI